MLLKLVMRDPYNRDIDICTIIGAGAPQGKHFKKIIFSTSPLYVLTNLDET